MASKRKVRQQVAKALRKYVRGNAGRKKHYGHPVQYRILDSSGETLGRVSATSKTAALREARRFGFTGKIRAVSTGSPGYANPAPVKGRKTKGGRAVTLRNFTGTIVKKSDGTVQIVGRGRRK